MKKNKQQKQINTFHNATDTTKTIIVIGAVLVLLAAFYFITAYFVTGELRGIDRNAEEATSDAVIQYEEILAGSIFNRPVDKYNVLVMNASDRNFAVVRYMAGELDTQLFVIDSDKTINNFIIGEKNNITNSIDTLKVTVPTILTIENGKITNHVSGIENVREFVSQN